MSIKISVAKKFNRYCKYIGKSKSMTLIIMLEFFGRNEMTPLDSLDSKIQTLENVFKIRMNGMIAMLKNIKKHQTKPTVEMLQALIEEAEFSRKPIMEQKVRFEEKRRIKEYLKLQFQIKTINASYTVFTSRLSI
ncbi:BfmA/BtgA family mobilization protein [Formosa sp. PL04]|uniref:BfmA/BtgA family mobilization protein n=1 Tax=Formosa sp. PL04 TaxID=3081755 RepID=UPI002980EE06|nr:BfmA/BtgA family mobilization protein [Formosa sp. PL04]MDW5288022.1 BfmA/BtgA family mobilization protein [Formosa sp. PL04]